ncbi:MAG: hypothetical protein KGK12_11770 [Armatimonadetes bacterium]|nr:hypothetical protein [Armatimonadota bacterium]
MRTGVAAALQAAVRADQATFMQQLTDLFERLPVGSARVERRGSLFGEKRPVAVSLSVGELVYTLRSPSRGPLVAERTHVVRGIAIKTAPLSVEDWLEEVSRALEEQAKLSTQARDALNTFING